MYIFLKLNKIIFCYYHEPITQVIGSWYHVQHLIFKNTPHALWNFSSESATLPIYISLRWTPWDNLINQLLKPNRIIPETQWTQHSSFYKHLDGIHQEIE